MKIIRYANGAHLSVLGEPTIMSDNDYVFGKHCLIHSIDDGMLIFNSISRAIVYLHKSEMDNLKDIKTYRFLYKTYFLVPQDFDSNKYIDLIRNKLITPIDDLYLTNPSEFTILTTTGCNARCFYCYENISKHKHPMTENTALQVAKYITNVAPEEATIHLDWFGGEPLFNAKVINIITNALKAKHRNYESSMISNGYLFSKTLVDKAVNEWNLKSVQITIDGTESIYNKVKNYIYKDNISPYKRVMDNIKLLLDANVFVAIRLNIDNYNIEDVKKLISEIYSRFELNPNLTIYVWPIFEENGYTRNDEETKSLFKGLEEIETLINDYGYKYGAPLSEHVEYYQCMADVGEHVTISPDGDLGTCEHYIDSKFFGHINSEEKNYDVLKTWRNYEAPLDICKDCPLYGNCIRPSECIEMRQCSPYIKEWKIRKSIYTLVDMYEQYKIL